MLSQHIPGQQPAQQPGEQAVDGLAAAARPMGSPLFSTTAAVWHSTESPPQPDMVAAREKPMRSGVSSGVREKSSVMPTAARPARPPRESSGREST